MKEGEIAHVTDTSDDDTLPARKRYTLYTTGPVFKAPVTVFWCSTPITRPTTSFARGCKLWSHERQFYEEERRRNMADFASRPYLHKQYPEIEKHWPGTWRVVGPKELEEIVVRLRKPTSASYYRQRNVDALAQSAPPTRQRSRDSTTTGRSSLPSAVTKSTPESLPGHSDTPQSPKTVPEKSEKLVLPELS